MNKKGFGIIEVILYVGIFAVFATGAIYFGLDILNIREKSYKKQNVDASAQIALTKIANEIKSATGFTLNSVSDITLTKSGSTSRIYLSNGSILLESPVPSTAVAITSNQVTANSLSFVSKSSTNNDTKNIDLTFTLSQDEVNTTLSSSVELNNPFNSARKVLVDYSSANASTGTAVSGMTINVASGLGSVIVDKIVVSWSGVTGVSLTGVTVGTSSWSGTAVSGQELDLVPDYTQNQLSPSNINLTFSSDITGATINVKYIFSDLSEVDTSLAITGDMCAALCLANEAPMYAGGGCYQPVLDGNCPLTQSNLVNLPAGDAYCQSLVPGNVCCCDPEFIVNPF